MRVGVEVGGTFTDLVAIDGETVIVGKVASTPARPDQGALAALEAAAIMLAGVEDLVHGSTVATNAILERKGAPTAFITTAGFRDILALQRHSRRNIYDLAYAKPAPVVRRRDCHEIDERIGPDGEVVVALDDAVADARLREILAGGNYRAVAVCFLNAYANPAHEARVAEMIGRIDPGLAVTCSHDVTREFREYERASTTTLAAYVQPVIDSYLSRFEASLGERDFAGRFSVMQSNGGRLPAAAMGRNAITSLFSGPAAGVIGAVRQAGLSSFRDLITLDMGGTSTDVCLVADGMPAISGETEVDGLPIRTPVLDIVTVGAGGGSIIWVDDGGMLRAGPRSAGADPGPACYGKGGGQATVTDAHLARGTIRADARLGGHMTLDAGASEAALRTLADRFGRGIEEIAADAIRVADANIVRAIQLVSTERGRDPRDYALVSFGGAGPLHAAAVARELDIATVVVPPNAGVLSAYGLLASDYVTYETRTRRIEVDDAAADAVREVFAELGQVASDRFQALGVKGEVTRTHTLDMRHVGQAFEVTVPLGVGELVSLDEASLMARFDAAHHRVFEFGGSGGLARAEIVSFRLGSAFSPGALPALKEAAEAGIPTEIEVFDAGARVTTARWRRAALPRGDWLDGPMLIEDVTSTILVPAGWRAQVDACDNLVMKRR